MDWRRSYDSTRGQDRQRWGKGRGRKGGNVMRFRAEHLIVSWAEGSTLWVLMRTFRLSARQHTDSEVTPNKLTSAGRHDFPPPSPTIVLEVGFSEPPRQLSIDARSWLESNRSPVNLAITASINGVRPEIVVRCRELNYRRNRPKADYYQHVKILWGFRLGVRANKNPLFCKHGHGNWAPCFPIRNGRQKRIS